MKRFLAILILLVYISPNVLAYEPTNEAKLIYIEGVNQYKSGDLNRAVTAFKKVIEIDKNYIDAYFNLGTILMELDQNKEALTVFRQIIIRKPDDYEAVYKAAYLCVKLGENDNAKSYLSIIPQSADIAPKAQELAHLLQTDMQTIKTKEKEKIQANQKVKHSNDVFNNITSPTGITSDNEGNIYVASFSNNTIYKITPDNKRLIFLKDVRVNGPIGMVSDTNGNIYIANYNNNNVLKVSAVGNVSVLIGNVQKPYGLYVAENILYISSQGSNSVIKYVLK